jgi:hypothetical protein
MNPVGRPPEKDKNGETITRSTVNVTVPSRLIDFLKEEGVNRSKLFTKAATELYEERLCPVCFTKDVKVTAMGIRCDGACSRYKTFFFKLHQCDQCERHYNPGFIMPVKKDDRIICESCMLEEEH